MFFSSYCLQGDIITKQLSNQNLVNSKIQLVFITVLYTYFSVPNRKIYVIYSHYFLLQNISISFQFYSIHCNKIALTLISSNLLQLINDMLRLFN